MRLKYGFNPRNETKHNDTIIRNDSGEIIRIVKEKTIYPHNTLDAAIFIKEHKIQYYDDGKVKSDTIQRRICSIWGYDFVKGKYKLYYRDGSYIKKKYESKQHSW